MQIFHMNFLTIETAIAELPIRFGTGPTVMRRATPTCKSRWVLLISLASELDSLRYLIGPPEPPPDSNNQPG